MADGQIHSAEFRRTREESWRRLEDLLGRIGDRERALSQEELSELPQLYRTTLSSLSVARNYVLDQRLIAYLEALCLRAYVVVYAPRERLGGLVAKGLSSGFPRAICAAGVELVLSLLCMTVGLVAGWAMVATDPELYYSIIPEALAGGRGPDQTTELMAKSLEGGVETAAAAQSFVLQLASHNAGIALLAAGLGIAFGLPTILLLAYNGAILGAMLAAFDVHGLLIPFIAWLSVHGVTELGAIIIAGAGGLAIARGLLFPRNDETRMAAARRHGMHGGFLAAGAFAMLFVAAIFEGVFRQAIEPTWARFLFAGVTAAFWLWYFSRGRAARRARPNG
jgi:uncharacterized membrane protein SpoIIM required for sporulation